MQSISQNVQKRTFYGPNIYFVPEGMDGSYKLSLFLLKIKIWGTLGWAKEISEPQQKENLANWTVSLSCSSSNLHSPAKQEVNITFM